MMKGKMMERRTRNFLRHKLPRASQRKVDNERKGGGALGRGNRRTLPLLGEAFHIEGPVPGKGLNEFLKIGRLDGLDQKGLRSERIGALDRVEVGEVRQHDSQRFFKGGLMSDVLEDFEAADSRKDQVQEKD